MIEQERFPVEPWCVREIGFDASDLAQTESVFALSNGHIGIRGNLDEGDPNGLPGTYLNSFYEVRPLPYAEAGYGYPESGQSVVNVTNGKLIRLLVNDEPFDMRYGEIVSHERRLDLRHGTLHRDVEWAAPSGVRVRVHSTRMVSLRRRSLIAISYCVEAVDDELGIVIQSELVANEKLPHRSNDPRVAAAIDRPLIAVEHACDKERALLVHRTEASKLNLAVAMDHLVELSGDGDFESDAHDDWARFTVSTRLRPGESCEVTKFVAYGWSSARSIPSLRDQVEGALTSATQAGWQSAVDEQSRALAEYWDGADVEIDGAPEIQQAVRFGMFHAFQAGARAEQRAIPAKGLTGDGYDGHAFWDTEMFVLPMLSATAPRAAADALRWRLLTLDHARDRAKTLGLRGAAFPWRTIRGQECSAYWPAGTAALHVNADIASAAMRHVWWTHDDEFERDCALPLLVETARLWASMAYEGSDGRFHIDGVTGPDEYSAVVDDNTYTNLLAARNAAAAARAVERWPDEAALLEVHPREVAQWRRIADNIAVPYDDDLGVHEQDRGFTRRRLWDFDRSADDDAYPLLNNDPYFRIYHQQVCKQADLVLAMHWCDEWFTPEQKARNFAYYDRLTVRDSSLSAATQAVLAAEVGHLDLAVDYLAEAALIDLDDLEHNAGDGLHIASLAGAWLALVAGFGGMRDLGDRLVFRPQLPPGWSCLRFTVRPQGGALTIAIADESVTYALDADSPLEIAHRSGSDEEVIELKPGKPVTRSWTPVQPLTPRPTQPPGREPKASRDPIDDD